MVIIEDVDSADVLDARCRSSHNLLFRLRPD